MIVFLYFREFPSSFLQFSCSVLQKNRDRNAENRATLDVFSPKLAMFIVELCFVRKAPSHSVEKGQGQKTT